jgi:predicted ester cyclase
VATWYATVRTPEDAALAAVLAPGFAQVVAGHRGDARTLVAGRVAVRDAFADLACDAHLLHAADGIEVVATVTTGTQRAPFLGHPSRGRAFRATGLDVFRLVDGRIAEVWGEFDTFGMLRQLGIAETR